MNPPWTDALPGLWFFLAALGLCLGSFLNVVIYRLPLGRSLLWPRSRCPRCEAPIAPWDNIPVVSYLLLRGRCRKCRAPISIRYPLVELAGAAAVLLSARYCPGVAPAALCSFFLLAMVAVTLIDYDHRIIPDEISLPGIVIGVVAAPLLGITRLDALIGAVSGGGALLLVAALYRWVRHADGMGGGDIKLAAMLGAFLGWKGVILTILLGSTLGSLVGVTLLSVRRASGKTALPFGTFLAPAAAVVLFLGTRVWTWYSGLFH